MDFDAKDIESVAKARVARAEQSRTMIATLAGFGLVIVGFFALNSLHTMAYVLMGVGIVVAIGWMYMLQKKQSTAASELLAEWNEEWEKNREAK